MNEISKALEALDRIFNYCEEIDLHIPEEEQVGYDMLVDINIIREALINQKIGHWIKHENPNLGHCLKISYECSCCKVWLGCEYFVRKSYCPNCGAKMEGEVE